MISITEDNGGAPGAVIESFVVSPQSCVDLCSDLYTIDSVLHPLLSIGSTYWITWAAASPTCACSAPNNTVWMNDLGTIGNVDQSPDGSTWHSVADDNPPPPGYLPAFDVNGTLVTTPEPSSGVLLFGGLALLGRYRHRLV
jgi:hypothetical protein